MAQGQAPQQGLTDTPRCIFCGAVDDVDHRLFGPCSGKALDRKSWRELFPAYGIADRQRELRRKGFLDSLALIPPLADDDLICFHSEDPDRIPGDMCFNGSGVYGDGSADKHIDPLLNRAEWSIIQIDNHGNLRNALAGSVLRGHPQASPSAEHHALGA